MSQSTLKSVNTDATPKTRDWQSIYARRLVATDLLVLVWVVFGVQIAWLGFSAVDIGPRSEFNSAISYSAISVAIVAGWMMSLALHGTRDLRVLGIGPQEYKLVTDGTVRVFGLVAIVAFLFKIDLARGYILIAFPLGLLTLLFTRWIWRQWLGVQRINGGYSSKVLLVGSKASATSIARELIRQPAAGYRVVGACVASDEADGYLPGTAVPVFGTLESVTKSLEASGADTVIITSADELPPERVRELSWSLLPGRQHLVVAPSLMDIGGPRIHTRPVAGLPLIHVETPRYEGRKRVAKRALDIVGSGLMLLLLSPILFGIAVAVRLTSEGPVFYRQERIGLNGNRFGMLKFRSMVANADEQLSSLLAAQGSGSEPLFKIQNDQRITRIGAVLRKHSLDEFPQLLNVLRGEMSLVGPRPQREGEVALYDSAARRRLIVQPGMTGLWQVSGRSNLSWEQSIRLDLYYVENWSLAGDIQILWRTIRAVVAPSGAI